MPRVSQGFSFIESVRYGRKVRRKNRALPDEIFGQEGWGVMKHYRVDELRPEDFEKLKAHMDEHFGPCQVESLYWIPLEDHLLDEVQKTHHGCQPFCFAVELGPDEIAFELLIRTRNRMRCDCIRYANSAQRENIFRFADSIFETLKILT
jgi:hypothetical protein